MKKIGIKLADGSFYPILEEGSATKKKLNVTTVKDNQTTVKVGLYSSEISSMEDAEYIDTLKISNLKRQPNGAPTIGLSLGLDDEGRLSAELVDSETGQEAKTSVTLLSDMLGNDKNPGTGKGLLGAAEEINASEGIALSEIEEPPAAVTGQESRAVEATHAEETPVVMEEETIVEENAVTETSVTEEETVMEESRVAEEAHTEETAGTDFPLLDEEPLADIDEGAVQDADLLDEEPVQEEAALSEEDVIPEKNALAEIESFEQDVPAPDGNVLDEENALSEEMALPEEALPGETTLEEPPLVLEETPVVEKESRAAEEAHVEESTNDDFPLPGEEPLPDIDGGAMLDEEPLPDIDDGAAQDADLPDLNLPDFDENIFPESDGARDSAPPKSEIQEAFGNAEDKLDFSDTDFEMPDFGDSINGGAGFGDLPDLDFTKDALDDPFADDENFTDESDENEKTQKWPVIICLICALICILAVLSLLFILPSKFNLFLSQDEKMQAEPAQEVTQLPPPSAPKAEEIQIPIVPAAKEDEIVVIPQAELVVPDLPYKKPEHQAREISYKIKWGDTLWDLSATYYKNPWLYPKIAKYNNIKNPNYIVAGTYIKIPDVN